MTDQKSEIWVVASEDHSKKLEKIGIQTIIISPGTTALDSQTIDIIGAMDEVVIFADFAGPDGYAEQIQSLLTETAISIRIEHFDSDEAKQEADSQKLAIELESELIDIQQMDDITYESHRKSIAKKLNVRVSWLDEQRKASHNDDYGSNDVVEDTKPWPEAVDGNLLMKEVVNCFERYIVLPAGAAVAMAAWVFLTYCYDLFRVLPILGILSPQKRCGKTTTMDVLIGLSYRALPASNISPAAVFRSIEKFKPTLFIDEADSFLKDNEEMRGVLNSGHTKPTAWVLRCDGDNHDPKKFSTWGPKAIAAIGSLPGTISDRSITVRLRRKAQNESREKIGSQFEKRASALRKKILRWAVDNINDLKKQKTTIAIPGNDRATDNWTPLGVIAEILGSDWPDRLSHAVKMLHGIKDRDDDDLGILILSDSRDIFDKIGVDRIFSENLKNLLNGLEERPWVDLKGGKGLTTNVLARFLSPFDIESKRLRIGTENKRGYLKEHFTDAWNRYLPAEGGCLCGTMEQDKKNSDLFKNQLGTEQNVFHLGKRDNFLNIMECSTVPLQKGGAGGVYKNSRWGEKI